MSEKSVLWGFDIDSVVGDLTTVMERVALEEFGEKITRDMFTDFDLISCLPYEEDFIIKWVMRALDPHWTAKMKPYAGAVDVLTKVSENQPLYFVTARTDEAPIRKWLCRHLSGVPEDRIFVEAVGHSGNKLEVLLDLQLTHFIDDRLETCRVLDKNGIAPVVYEQPWNIGKHSFETVRSWEDICDIVLNGRC